MAKLKCLFRTLFIVLGFMAIPLMWEYANSKPAITDIRCCVDEIARNADGSIKRSSQVRRDFQQLYPCPSTGLRIGSCDGWQIDHVISLACGGVDAIYNLQWLPVEIKTCKEDYCKDRFERKIYCHQDIIHLAK